MKRDFFIGYFLLIFIMTSTCFVTYSIIDNKVDSNNDNNEAIDNDEAIIENVERNQANVIVNYDDNYELKKYYNENNLDKKLVDFSNCLHTYISIDNLSQDIKDNINELNEYYNNDDRNFAFYYLDLNTSFSVSYNAEQPIFGASTMKAPFIIYVYKQASLGNIDLDEKLQYTANFYSTGSGVLQGKEIGGEYSVRELCYYAINDSDNIAYRMLSSRFGIGNARAFWQENGVNSIYHNDVIFSEITAKDAGTIMKYLYDFSLEDETYGKELMNYFTNALYFFIPKNGLTMAHKSGWAGYAIHDLAIKFDDNPYVIVVLSKRGEIEYDSLFKYTSDKISEIHKSYWDSNINQCRSEEHTSDSSHAR